jgi:cytochrome bd-type quinol oxidase subunit 2
MMCKGWLSAAATALLGLAFTALAPGIAFASWQAASPSPNPPGSTNSSPQDYNGAIWVVVGVVIVAAIVAGGTFFLIRTRRIDVSQRSTPEDEEHDTTKH